MELMPPEMRLFSWSKGDKCMAKGETYEEFVNKFKPKKTTDDCYTPDNIYEAVKDWAVKRYGITERIMRPFYPGGDFEKEDYTGAVVIDNPPFSIFSKIVDFYLSHGVKFFLFRQTNTLFGLYREGLCYIPVEVRVIYENGASVNTSFVTNMSSHLIETAPDLYEALDRANKENEREMHKQFPRMEYPDAVITATEASRLCKSGQRVVIDKSEAYYTRALDDQRKHKKAIYGGGYILSDAAAARVAAARVAAARVAAARVSAARVEGYTWHFSEREEEIRKGLG